MEQLQELLGHPTELYNLVKFKMSGSGVSKVDQDLLSDGLRACYKYLNETGPSFAVIVQVLDEKLRSVSGYVEWREEGGLCWWIGLVGGSDNPVACIFYLVLRALDTVEDDMTISLERKIPILQNFHSYLYQPDWKFMDSQGKHKQVLEDFPTISLEFRKLAKVYQDVIADICHRMGHGMAEFLEKKVDSVKDWEKYCYYVGGLVGIGLFQIFSASKLKVPTAGQNMELVKSMGIFLQKTNIIRDYLEDQLEGREFWPKEVWSKYARKLSDLANPENIDKAVQCMNELITNALHHVPDALTFLSRVKNQNVFNICAFPQVMAIATLATCYNNQQAFRGVVKIQKGEAVTLMMEATNIQAVKAITYQYMEEIYRKIPSKDPSLSKIQQIISSVQSTSKLRSGFISRIDYMLICLSCIMLLVAFWSSI
ncbi:hypothetical protein lerEdw1_015358 [Lerista edwardsae]|nr:hypothetical protein lerEdw1_015358 [Lerista edwardsae]